jgi:hypothetical protein
MEDKYDLMKRSLPLTIIRPASAYDDGETLPNDERVGMLAVFSTAWFQVARGDIHLVTQTNKTRPRLGQLVAPATISHQRPDPVTRFEKTPWGASKTSTFSATDLTKDRVDRHTYRHTIETIG